MLLVSAAAGEGLAGSRQPMRGLDWWEGEEGTDG